MGTPNSGGIGDPFDLSAERLALALQLSDLGFWDFDLVNLRRYGIYEIDLQSIIQMDLFDGPMQREKCTALRTQQGRTVSVGRFG
jgi:hypothetical protein